jgi:hypothetical protein
VSKLDKLNDMLARVNQMLSTTRGRRAVTDTLLRIRGENVASKRKPRKPDKFVNVFLDNERFPVPRRVDCHWAFAGALGLSRRDAVALEGRPDEAIIPTASGYTFHEGERFVRMIAKSQEPELLSEQPKIDERPKAPGENSDELTRFEKGIQDGDENWWKHGG